jgi:hypothetical protein
MPRVDSSNSCRQGRWSDCDQSSRSVPSVYSTSTWALGVIENELEDLAVEAVAAMGMYRGDEAVRRRVEEAVRRRGVRGWGGCLGRGLRTGEDCRLAIADLRFRGEANASTQLHPSAEYPLKGHHAMTKPSCTAAVVHESRDNTGPCHRGATGSETVAPT